MELKKIFLLIMFVIAYYCSLGQLPNNDPSWQLIFNDDFSGTSIDNSKWNSNYPWNQGSYLLTCDNNQNGDFVTINSEYVGYRTWNFENCELNNNILKIISKQESYLGKVWDDWIPIIDPNTGDTIGWNPIETWHNFNYTTGMLYSKMKIRYGYFEIRCKLPEPQNPHETKGLGPNFWIFDGNCDIAEYSEKIVDIKDGEIIVNHKQGEGILWNK
jgi:beta-glucanase (GH16 family)